MMAKAPVDTALVIVVGPCIDDTDFKTIETGIAYNRYGDDIIDAETDIVYKRLDEIPDGYEEAVRIEGNWYLPNRKHWVKNVPYTKHLYIYSLHRF